MNVLNSDKFKHRTVAVKKMATCLVMKVGLITVQFTNKLIKFSKLLLKEQKIKHKFLIIGIKV